MIHKRPVARRRGRVLGAFGIDESVVYERNACTGEESELATCRSRVESCGGGEHRVEIHTPWQRKCVPMLADGHFYAEAR